MKILFVRSWRSEMMAIQRSIILALQSEYPLKTTRISSGTLATLSEYGRQVLIVCCEDDWRNISESDQERSAPFAHLFRFWFNQPSQIASANIPNGPTTDVAFFKEFGSAPGGRVEILDYAPESSKSKMLLSSPVSKILRRVAESKILFIGEVSSPGELESRYGKRNYQEWKALVDDVLDGKADLEIIIRDHTSEQFIFGFQNVFRQAILTDVIDHFGKRTVVLVGSDWSKLGLHSLKTKHSPGLRRLLQTAAGVCLDTGSKSTWSLWYPRFNELVEDGGLISSCVPRGISGVGVKAFGNSRSDILDAISRRQADRQFSAGLDDALHKTLVKKQEQFRSTLKSLIEGHFE